jgi:ribose transport system ATP-binding protein
MSEILALRMHDVRKRFGSVVALRGVDLEVHAGEAHALVGENGAGKSTLMKVLSGAHRPDGGTMELLGARYAPRGPREALEAGVAMIYQELNLAPDLTVEENVVLGREPHRFGFVRRGLRRAEATQALELLDRVEIDPARALSSLSPGERQVVEIARALAARARVVVMDEPTSSLSAADGARLLEVVRRVCAQGVAVIYISHFLEEVLRIARRYTVLRDGATVATGDVAETSARSLIESMVGRPVDEAFPRVPRKPGSDALVVDDLSGRSLPRSASLRLRHGEIFGVAGLVGAGRTELLRAIFGLDPVTSGALHVLGAEDGGAPAERRIAQRVGLVSESRKEEGLLLPMSIAENITLSRLGTVSRGGFVDRDAQRRAAARWVARLGIRCSDPSQPVSALSGGNQQKVAIARLLHQDALILLLDEPTRGIDVASKVEIYRLMGELAAEGRAILFVSSYLPELLGVADRIAVMRRGRLGPSRPVSEWTEGDLLAAATMGGTER